MVQGGLGVVPESNGDLATIELKKFSWEEIQEKTTRADRWIVIDDEVYNITQWVKRHPGGSRVISHYSGQDATDAFRAFHTNMDLVRRYMKTFHIGSVRDEKEERDPSIEEDFRELRTKLENMVRLRTELENMGMFKSSGPFFMLVLLHIVALDWAGWAFLHHFGTGWLPFVTSAIILGFSYLQCLYLSHDFGHSVFDHTVDRLLQRFTFGFMSGLSGEWWNHLHFQHHAKPNVISKDPDVRIDALFVVGETMPLQAAKRKDKSMPYNWQNYYFPLTMAPLSIPVYLTYMNFKFVLDRKARWEMLAMILFYARFMFMFCPLLGLGWTLVLLFSAKVLHSHFFTWTSQSSHLVMNVSPDSSKPWFQLQLDATCNYTGTPLIDWYTGHLNYQIEHHMANPYTKPFLVRSLFPTMPRHNYSTVAPMVKSLCDKHHIPYIVKPLFTAYADLLRSLGKSGQLWEQAYYEAHHLSTPR